MMEGFTLSALQGPQQSFCILAERIFPNMATNSVRNKLWDKPVFLQ